ncbi:sensor histidine kinase [Tepidicella baoligensis]|uniref:sensor histidine kinase n=1 Tax=Tepidicella baoligensis TaxID=2707016 RepID=UPI0015DB740B|nr:ATP-binding protein [Tepidicella baoligensis]
MPYQPLRLPAGWRQLPHYVWVGLILLGLLAALYWVSRPGMIAGAVHVDRIEVSVIGRDDIPPKMVELPHVLDDESPPWHQRVAYRLNWPAELDYDSREGQRLALLLPRVDARFRVLLNDHEIFSIGWYAAADRTILSGLFPYHIPLPAGLLAERPQDNVLVIEVQGVPLERSGLSPFQIGEHDPLFDRYRVLEIWQVMGGWMMAIASVFMGLISIFLWYSLKERLFLLMAAASLAHVVRLLLLLMLESPLSPEWHFFVYRLAFNLYVAFFCLFIEELFGLQMRVVRWLAYFLLVSGPLWLLAALWTESYTYARIWAGGLALLAGVSLFMLFVRVEWGRRINQDQALVMVVALFTLITGVRDFLVLQLHFPGDADIRWMSIGSLALMFTLGWVLVQRATASTREVHRLNQSLAEIVARREAELRQAFEQLRVSEQQRAVEGERRRLMRDMHDGLGSQLVQTLNMVRSQRGALDPRSVEAMIHHALEELRMTLDSLEPMEGDLPTILGTFRQRIAPALDSAGIALVWDVQEVPALSALDSRGIMHLFRCMQEIFANVVKHSRATAVTVRTFSDAEAVYLCVEDNGIGLSVDPSASGNGRGLGNLRVRAAKLGAHIRFYSVNPGTGVEFRFPMQHPVRTEWAHTGSGEA